MGKKKKESTGTYELIDKDMQIPAEGDIVVTKQENVRKKKKKKKNVKDYSPSDQVPNIDEKQEGKKKKKIKKSDKLEASESEITLLQKRSNGSEDGDSTITQDVTEHATEKSKKKKRKAEEALIEDLTGESACPKKKKLLELPRENLDDKGLTVSNEVKKKSKKAKKEKAVESSEVNQTDVCHKEKQNDDGLMAESFISTENSHQKKKDKKRKKKKSKADNEESFANNEPGKKVAEKCNGERSEKKQKEKHNNEVILGLKESAKKHMFDNIEGISTLDNTAGKNVVHCLPVCYDPAEENCEAYQKKQMKKETIDQELKETDQIQGKGGSKKKKRVKKSQIEAGRVTDSPKSRDEMNYVETEQKRTNKQKKIETTVKEETIEPKLELSSDCAKTKEKHKKKKRNKKDDEESVNNKLDGSSSIPSQKEKSNDNDTKATATAVTPSAVAINAGQWNTSNMFESDTRQEKFLRLLGGFRKANESSANGSPTSQKKKGLFGSLQTKTVGQSALTYQAAQLVEKRLESDFEKALCFRGQRGVGLGFTPDPAEGKKFHININKTASKKFDD